MGGVMCSNAGSDRRPSGVSTGDDGVARQESGRGGFRAGLVREQTNRDIWSMYSRQEKIGSGLTGGVWRIKSKRTGESFAVKTIMLDRIDATLLEDLRNEIELLKLMDHPNIIKLYETFDDGEKIYLVMELCTGGELYDRLKDQRGYRFPEEEASRLVGKMLSAISYCHKKQISHRDLKLENFVFETKKVDSNIKLIDFGLSRKYGSDDNVMRMTTMVGTAYYIAPEVVTGKRRSYTQKVDMWSLGVIAYMLLSGKPPFKGNKDRDILAKVKKADYDFSHTVWKNVSQEAIDFIKALMQVKPAKRATAEQALQMPWVRRQFESSRRVSASRPLPKEIVTSLRTFSHYSGIKRAALEALAFSMNAKELAGLRHAFESIDSDRTGMLTPAELRQALAQVGVAPEEADEIFRHVNQDGTNYVSYTEFLAATLSRREFMNEPRILEAFDRLDVDNTGVITPDNLQVVLGDEFTPERVASLILEGDFKNDGQISRDEFLRLFTEMQEESKTPATSPVRGAGAGAGAGAGNVMEAMEAAAADHDADDAGPLVAIVEDDDEDAPPTPAVSSRQAELEAATKRTELDLTKVADSVALLSSPDLAGINPDAAAELAAKHADDHPDHDHDQDSKK